MKNFFESVIEFSQQLTDVVKPHFFAAISFTIMWLQPIYLSIGIVLIAISLDTLAGRWAAKHVALKENKVVREEVTSRKTREGFVAKVIQYILCIILTFMLDSLILHDLVSYFLPSLDIQYFSTKFLAFILVMIEFDSFDEKWYRVKNKSLKEVVAVKLKKVKEMVFQLTKIKREL